MKVERLDSSRIKEFISYCKNHRSEQDSSYLHDDDLERFDINEENPTFLLLDARNSIIGAASLIINEYYSKGNKGRFRIFHSVIPEKEVYELMLEPLLMECPKHLESLFIHVPDKSMDMADTLEALGFTIERYSFGLILDDINAAEAVFPQGFELRTFQKGRDEVDWCEVRNAAFANHAGSNTPKTPDMIHMEEDEGHIDGGAFLLYDGKVAVGMVRVVDESDNGASFAFVDGIGVKPGYQGMGLGKNLLRAALNFGKIKGYSKAMLSVNAENEKAIELYTKEGFKMNYKTTCYQYTLKASSAAIYNLR